MKFYILLFYFFLFNFLKVNGSSINYYILLKKETVELGKYNEEKAKKIKISTFPKNKLANSLDSIFNTEKQKKILLYFHGIKANDAYSQKFALKRLRKLSGIDATISIIWKAKKITYKGSWKEAIKQGEDISLLISETTRFQQNKYYLLCHSMGHRLLEGALKNGTRSTFEAIFFAAPDLDINVFNHHFKILPSLSKQIIVYSNTNDVMLRLSKYVHKRERLGLNIIQYKTELDSIPNLSMVDVTYSNYGKQDRFTKHSFWMKNENVLKDINFIVNDTLERRKEILDQKKDNYYILK